ncbi:src homology 2 domain containing transforming protein D, a isoform X1 [Neoarius graeffei]|uniref:src homology 2 domain containing transforming protein D, a isoform X1 n=1 Tax=Neoarius graeffei TaxID=443677 RepID=UPI00298C4DAC|nr:src homology 2 domain containing transforming protein D, a isoform X1 [Neoarius graeffei]XP_060762217.1 src homology 2 domain containing transforming protein D, a isoform X1 [Neoarius graeffei]XP_060762218.1 src homology 2 domain containing transforming protein D, a isoform X1 [Neoarius graeffei]
MAKWLKDYLNFGSRKGPPQPPKPDYTESEILRAYRAQKELDFEDPYEPSTRANNGSGTSDPFPAFGTVLPNGMEVKIVSPKHRLIKVESQEFNRCKVPLGIISFEEPHVPVVPSAPAVGDTDYSDPFDARPDPRAHLGWESGSVENSSSYMEPFEAQRVMTELQHGLEHGRTVSRGSPQLYDSPYEERGHYRTGFPDDERESRLPQDDERPADEYDQPWEWKKENISKALAVQFDGGNWERSTLPHTDQHRRTGVSRTSPPSSKATSLHKPSDHHTMLGERVDPALPLEQQVWYHGALTRSEAESLLTLCKECSYLVRNSQTSRNDYSLSLRSCHGFMHMKFSQSRDGKYILGENSPPFDTIPEVIHYYTTHKLPIRGAEHLSLLFPVVVQTL